MDNISLNPKSHSLIKDVFALPLLIRDAFITSMIISMIAIIVHNEISTSSLLLVITIGIGYTLGFAVNDYFDRDIDKFDNVKVEKNYFISHSHSLGLSVLWISLVLLSIASSSYSQEGALVLLVGIFGFWSYSAEPLRFKSRPGYDLVTHGVFIETFPFLITLYLLKIHIETIDYFIIIILFFNSIINQIGQQLRDYDTDILTETNFTISIGPKSAKIIIRILNLIMGILILGGSMQLFDYPILFPIVVISLPIYILRLMNYNVQTTHSKLQGLYKLSVTMIFLYLVSIIIGGILF